MIVEIPDPEIILAVVLPVFVGLFSLFVYLRIRQISAFNTQNKADSDRLEFYERQLIDMKIRLDAIDLENLGGSHVESSKDFVRFEEKVRDKEEVPVAPQRPISQPAQARRTPNMGFDNVVDAVLGLITEKSMTSRDIQVTLGRSREHVSRTMKKLFEDGLVERNTTTKPFSYSITEKGRQRIGIGGSGTAQMAPEVV